MAVVSGLVEGIRRMRRERTSPIPVKLGVSRGNRESMGVRSVTGTAKNAY